MSWRSTTSHRPPRWRRPAIVVAVAGGLAVTALAGCGGGDEAATTVATTEAPAADVTTAAATTEAATTSAATEAASTTPADQWVASVCGALSTWQNDLTTGVPDLTAITDLDAAKETLGGYLDDVTASTDTLVQEIQAAGVPDVEGGDDIASEFRTNLESVRDSFSNAKTELESLSTDDPNAFAAGLEDIGTALNQAGTDVGQAFDRLASEHPTAGLNEVAANEPACQSLAS